MNRKIGIALFVIVAAALFGWYKFRSNPVSIVHPKRGDLVEAVYGLGKVKTDQHYEVIIGVLTTVDQVFVEEGQSVKAGSPLIKMESGNVFRAPHDGTITLVKARKGETVVPNIPLVRLENLQKRYIELSLDQETALRVHVGEKAKVSFETLRETILQGEVASLYSRNDEFIARVNVAGLEPNVLPGMTADVTINVGQIKNALLIPVKAVQAGMITVKRDGKWVKEKVEMGYVDGSFGEVRNSSLNETHELRIQETH